MSGHAELTVIAVHGGLQYGAESPGRPAANPRADFHYDSRRLVTQNHGIHAARITNTAFEKIVQIRTADAQRISRQPEPRRDRVPLTITIRQLKTMGWDSSAIRMPTGDGYFLKRLSKAVRASLGLRGAGALVWGGAPLPAPLEGATSRAMVTLFLNSSHSFA